MKFTFAIVRRGNVTAAVVMERSLIFDLTRVRGSQPVHIGRRLTELATFYDATLVVAELGSDARLGYPAEALPKVTYDPEIVRRTLLPDYAHGDGKRLQALIHSRYPELSRFLPKGRIVRAEHTSLLAAVALGLTHHLITTHEPLEPPPRPR